MGLADSLSLYPSSRALLLDQIVNRRRTRKDDRLKEASSLLETALLANWGNGDLGQFGTGNTSNQPQPALVPSLKGMSALLAGGFHSLAFPQEGGLLVFGYNKLGQLGLNHTTKLPTPTLCPVQPALPHSFTSKSRKKSARFL